MTTIANKFQDVAKQLQNLTIWRPNERDPLLELEQWRTNAHLTIEGIYRQKRQEIEQISEKHEREFLRQLGRQRLALNNTRKKMLAKKEVSTHVRAQYETSILNDLQRIEYEMNVRLGRAQVIIETIPFNCENLITIGLKTYLSTTPTMYFNELITKHQSQKPARRSANEAHRAYANWLETKNNEAIAQKELEDNKQRISSAREDPLTRRQQNEEGYKSWLQTKQAQDALKKKKLNIHNNTID
ncbi:unnamed protein product [Adineta steineri]|uniref:Uncharacterized protein n=1 Tax=Adineta steineri TaxID=433720 RepID=A0A818SQI3_9BILA|nr:unnamed protein product [Adineta steineri]CAF3676055.1 unnamed protein product [Adineta steineri]